MAAVLVFYGLYDILYTTDDKLNELGCSEIQMIAVQWTIRNILIAIYFIDQYRFPWIISNETMLTYGSGVFALTSVWLPLVKDHQSISIILMCLQAVSFLIGPLHTVKMFFLHRGSVPSILVFFSVNDNIQLFAPLVAACVGYFKSSDTGINESFISFIISQIIPESRYMLTFVNSRIASIITLIAAMKSLDD